ncbi:GNAT family N-acetyltransferase [Clostridium cellulovorans]|uniref:GCN5-related N-acetyltransferase n=1 Tax=Clostridium cellulovorans (strain ATCC 35296 / DSM 3052 / OCM 3 / 743B) TaxID=573061 RepID=D9SUZ0_CLOC7|nr:GNAT family N-acetyltransferase [Clostridium cellulovorans]ADL52965.1 GCN5-related N-acetyltransferase [Clostridium cellulovorans 743B]
MEIVRVNKENCSKLKGYWDELSKNIPYFYPVTTDELIYSLLEDRRYGEIIFNYLETYLIEEDNEILGFIQFGEPHIYWDTNGKKVYDPNIGVIRHIYFNEDRHEAGKMLVNKAEDFFKNSSFDNCFAFNHVLGLSCTAYHGKLHESKIYIAKLLGEYGYEIEHENVYYTIDLTTKQQVEIDEDIKVIKNGINEYNKEVIDFIYKGEKIGESVVLYLDNVKTVYMSTLWIDNKYSNNGFGSKFIKMICNDLRTKGYEKLDLDTAKNNLGGQRFYERNTFVSKGITRSYFK